MGVVDAEVVGEVERYERKAEGETEDRRELGEEEDDEVAAPVDDIRRGREVPAQARASASIARMVGCGCWRSRVAAPKVEGTRIKDKEGLVGGDGIEPPTSSMSS